MDAHDWILIGISILSLLVTLLAIPARVTGRIHGMFESMKTWVDQRLDKFRDEVKADMNGVYKRLSDVEKEQARMQGEHDAFTKTDNSHHAAKHPRVQGVTGP